MSSLIEMNSVKYTIIEEFQHGIEGKAFLTAKGDKKYVIKTIEKNINSGFRNWKKIKNEKISELYDIEEKKDGTYVLRTEYAAGMDLMDFLLLYEKTGDKLPREQVVSIIRQIISAVHYLHSCNIVHSDMKPENIVINEEKGVFSIKVIDLGQSKSKENCFMAMQKNGEGSLYVNGTRNYIPPELEEQTKLFYKEDVAMELLKGGDIYATGCIIEMITHFLLSRSSVVLKSNLRYLASCMKMKYMFRKTAVWCLNYINNSSIYIKELF